MTTQTTRQAVIEVLEECQSALGAIAGKYLNAPDDENYLNLARYTAAHKAVSLVKQLKEKNMDGETT